MRKFYISCGEQAKMYTLRHVWVAMGATTAQDKDDYVCNLSTDWNKAIEKAKAFLDKHYGNGWKLYGDRFGLQGITRRTPEQISEEERLEREAAKNRARAQVVANAGYNKSEIKRIAKDGVFTFGRFSRYTTPDANTFANAVKEDIGYIRFCIEKARESVGFDLSLDEHPRQLNKFEIGAYALAMWCADNHVDFMARKNADSRHVGTLNQKVAVEVVIESKKDDEYQVTAYRSSSFWKFTAVTNDGDVITFKTSAKAFKDVQAGDRLIVEGTVKYHYEYDEVKRTSLSRVKAA